MTQKYLLSEQTALSDLNAKLVRDCTFEATVLLKKSKEENVSYITYLTDSNYADALLTGGYVGVVCTPELLSDVREQFDGGIIVSEDPRSTFFEIHNNIYGRRTLPESIIDDTAIIADDAVIAKRGVSIAAGAVVGSGAIVSEGVSIGAYSEIMENCMVGMPAFYYYGEGDDRKRVCAGNGVNIGSRVTIHAGSVVQAGVFRPTVISDNVKISNRVHVSHDVLIERNCLIPAGVTIGGIVTLEENCTLGVGVTIAPGIKVGHDAKLSSGAVVTKDVPPDIRYSGNFAIEHSKYVAHIKNISS
ncbi:MAG: DapH/DapD/GlmU-related protein [Eubacteriales bacterium]|nr:DapH/DapD/GlmU-related protein [Eubacteriales bacterium]